MTVIRMQLPTQTMPNCMPLRPKRKVLATGPRGRLENVSEGATNQRCRVGSAGNVGCQKLFVGEIGVSGGLLPLFEPDIELDLPKRCDEAHAGGRLPFDVEAPMRSVWL